MHSYIHTYYSRFIPEEVAEVSQIFLRDTHVLPKLVVYENTTDVTGDNHVTGAHRRLIAVYLRCEYF
jgi:hypothetical protein